MVRYPQSKRISQLFSQGLRVKANKSDVIMGNEQKPNGVYYIVSGYVKVYSISNLGDEHVHIIYGAGELFPILWAYLGIEPSARYYTAISDCKLLRIPREHFTDNVRTDAEIGYDFSQQLAQQFRVYTDRVDNLEYKKADERVAYRILFLASRFGTKQPDGSVSIEAPITHEIFASSVNLARESVSREFQRLVHQEIVVWEGHRLVIHDVEALARKLSRPIDLNQWYLD
jgi:CRP-like cAMP-binding protein